MLGVTFEVITSDADESSDITDPYKLVEELSLRKGLAVRDALLAKGYDLSDTVIISSDTIVAIDGEILGKPVDEEEMILRIAALLRRSQIAGERKLTVGSTTLLYDSLSVKTVSGMMELPQKEFMLLFKLLSYPNKIYTRRQLMDEIWDMDSESDERTVDVHVSRVRDRFRNNGDFEIVTVRGLGYKAVVQK